MRQLRRDMPQRLTQSWRVGKFDDDCGLGQPPTANSSFSRITLSGSSRGNSGSWSGVIAWRNSLISVRQSSSVRSRGHSAESGSQQVIGSIPSSFPLCGGLTRKHNTVVLAAGSSIKPRRSLCRNPVNEAHRARGDFRRCANDGEGQVATFQEH